MKIIILYDTIENAERVLIPLSGQIYLDSEIHKFRFYCDSIDKIWFTDIYNTIGVSAFIRSHIIVIVKGDKYKFIKSRQVNSDLILDI